MKAWWILRVLTGSEYNIKKQIKEVDKDFQKEYKDLIQDMLWTEFGPKIMKEARRDLHKWFMEKY